MDSSNYVLVAAWLLISGAIIAMGFGMIMNEKYRNYVASQWFRPDSESDRERNRRFVKNIGGIMYILIGLSFIVIGLYVLYGPSQ